MSDPFNGIGYGMGQVVHGIDAPLIACPVMFGVDDAVEDGVAHIEVRAGHVDLGAKYLFAVGVLASFISSKRRRFSSTLRLRYGLSFPGSLKVPR